MQMLMKLSNGREWMKTKFAEDEYKLVGKILYIIAVAAISCGNKSYIKKYLRYFSCF